MHQNGQRGSVFGFLFLLIIFVIIAILLMGAFNTLSAKCIGDDIISCVLDDILGAKPAEEKPADAVTATGTLSGEFKGKTGSVTVSLTFPAEGGAVTGTFDGDCDGNIRGTYTSSSGAISGEGTGSCAFVFPVSGTFSGSVNKESKTIYVTGKGKAAGFTKDGSMTLSY